VDGRDLRFSFAAVDHLKLRIDEHNAAWESFFGNCAVGVVRVAYEDLLDDYRGTMLRLLGEIGIDVPEGFAIENPRMNRQANQHSEEWVRRYEESARRRDRVAARTIRLT
jgi:LPS sulfotransferase NodH